ncbi:DUF4278 domain-containing protein [Ancylothrix sp. D3o]|uniref:DUF4278 domain-containing protein n=1 Tax=Ancylothrix sp. D3o TaxID=2953691 RepID=UPI0021BBA3C6|nr:DUF4278 domain-containing protein [Ancylothrix sp. D3o]
MKLSYRGVSYANEPPTLDMIDGDIGGKYRGQAWTVRQPRHIPLPPPTGDLKYRAVTYKTSTVDAVSAPPPTTPHSPYRHNMRSEVAQTHRDHLYKLLEKRMQAAQARGDAELLKLLENESKQLASLH